MMQSTQSLIYHQQSPTHQLSQLGQSLWLDYSRRSMIKNGELSRLTTEADIKGITFNLGVLQQAIAHSTEYDEALTSQAQQHSQTATHLYEQLILEDSQAAADFLRPIYHESHRKDGYVSLGISPYLANDAERMIVSARELWLKGDRPNLMIAVPATPAGLSAIQQLTSEGINVNATLLFSQATYLKVAEAYLTGLETFAKEGGDVSHVASLASFPISLIDIAADDMLARRQIDFLGNDETVILLKSLEGQIAIANARLAYQKYLALYASDRWRTLAKQGAQPQRLLWASTRSDHSKYSDVLYIEELIGANTVNSVFPGTLAAFRHHGKARNSLTEELDIAEEIIACLPEVLIDFNHLAKYLLKQSIQLLQQTFDQLLNAIEQKRE